MHEGLLDRDIFAKMQEHRSGVREVRTKRVFVDTVDVLDLTGRETAAIGTWGLGGCTAIAVVYSNLPARGALVAHYNPHYLNLGLHRRELKTNLEHIRSQGGQRAAIIASPGISIEEGNSVFIPDPSEAERVRQLTALIKERLGDETPIRNVPYQAECIEGWDNRGSVIIEFPKRLRKPPRILIDGIPLKQKGRKDTIK
jgi:hypothetical protein